MFNEYEKDGRVIRATVFAYEALYKSQGYVPREVPMFNFSVMGDFNFPDAEVTVSGQGHGDSANNSAGDKPKRNSRSKKA